MDSRPAAAVVAIVAAAGLAITGFVNNTWAAGGSDSSCYALMADAFARGQLQPTSALAVQAPWPDAAFTLAPAGFIPSPVRATGASPICGAGFSLLLAPLRWMAGPNGVFVATPLAAALLIWFVFVFARALDGGAAGAAAALLTATSPIVLFQAVQPMNDITTVMLWTGVLAAATREDGRRYWLMGAAIGVALLVRPNLAPSAVVAGLWVLLQGGEMRTRLMNAVRLTMAAAPAIAILLWLNDALYGHPLRVGYGAASGLFSVRNIATNVDNYGSALLQTAFGVPLIGFAAPFVSTGRARQLAILAVGMAAATIAVYLLYQPFREWWYLRFLLPALVPLTALAVVVVVRVVKAHLVPRFGTQVWPIAIFLTLVLVLANLQVAGDRQAFALQRLESRFWRTGELVAERLPANAVAIAVWESGTMRFHARREAVLWDSLDPAWLDRALAWLSSNGYEPYLIVERWEEEAFRKRFAAHTPLGQLDWPPRFEIDRQVRIYRPADRAAHLTGSKIATEYIIRRD